MPSNYTVFIYDPGVFSPYMKIADIANLDEATKKFLERLGKAEETYEAIRDD